ncbi:MAG: DMT family transporter [Synergistota bacterium]|nr:DMT family transporter [Synergistota bacterium]
MENRKVSLIKIHSAVLLFGITGLFGKFLNMPPQYIVLGRVFFASLSIGLYLFMSKSSIKLASLKDYIIVIAMGALLAVHWTSFFKSIQVSTVAIALLTFSAYPIFVTFIEPLMFEEKLNKIDVIFAFLMFVGVILIVPEFDLSNNLTIGVIWGMFACLTFSVMSLLNRKLAANYTGSVITFYEQATATIVLLPILLFYKPEMTSLDWGLIVLLGVVFTGLAHSLFIGGMKDVRAQTAGIIAGLESFYGIIFAVIILNEIPSVRELTGGLIILSTALVSTLMSSRQRQSN